MLVGKVDGRDYDGQQRTLFVTFMDGAKRFEAYSSQFVADFD